VEESLAMLQALAEAINATWEGRAELVAITAAQKAPHPLQEDAALSDRRATLEAMS
jgi:hypothetical protein